MESRALQQEMRKPAETETTASRSDFRVTHCELGRWGCPPEATREREFDPDFDAIRGVLDHRLAEYLTEARLARGLLVRRAGRMMLMPGLRETLDDETPAARQVHRNARGPTQAQWLHTPLVGSFEHPLPAGITWLQSSAVYEVLRPRTFHFTLLTLDIVCQRIVTTTRDNCQSKPLRAQGWFLGNSVADAGFFSARNEIGRTRQGHQACSAEPERKSAWNRR